ncbi:unnamed protein product [Prunus armeniaca]
MGRELKVESLVIDSRMPWKECNPSMNLYIGKKLVLKIINHKWDVTLSRPLHQAGVDHNKELFSGLPRVLERLNSTEDRDLQTFRAECHHQHVSEIGVHLLLFSRNKGTVSHILGNIDAVIAQHAAQEGVYVDRVIFEDVRSGDTSSFEMDMLGPRQDEDYECKEAGPCIGAIGKQYSRRRSQPINPSKEDMAISFGSISIGTRPSTNSNESYDGYGYVMSDYSGTSYGAQDDETDYGPTSWVNPNYPTYGRTVGSSRETYVHHVQTWLHKLFGLHDLV